MKTMISTMLILMASFAQALPDVAAPAAGSEVYFISPQDGTVVSSPFKVVMGLKGMGVAPAGTMRDNTGHHHLIINAPTPKAGLPIPADAQHKHFGGGQTEADVTLEKGTHTLQLVLGDFVHRPHSEPLASKVITVIVK